MKRNAALVLALALGLGLTSAAAGGAGPSASSGSGGGTLAFRETGEGTRAFNLPGEPRATVGRVLRSGLEAYRVLRELGVDRGTTKSVNWRRESAIVVLSAWVPTGGYRARVRRVDVHGREAVVNARVRYEGGDVATQSLERPWVVIAVKRSSLAGVRNEVKVKLR
ncbi:MAG TPA: hypothetical protein VMY78_05475 [Solirubrobacteraceae bacterium]|nr:hypothetical protein [Solirubrobacteraceae bacterium]